MTAEVEIVVNAKDNFSGTLGNFGNIMTGIQSTINLVGQAFDAAVGIITPFIESASESEQAVTRLEGVLQATGGAVGLTSEQLQGMANGLQGVTRFSDETILSGEAILLTFRNIGGEMFQRTVPAMTDMAEIFGSVDSAAMQLGKALNDPIAGMGALSRAGIQFSDTQKEMIKGFMETGDIASAQNIIMSEVEAQVKGLAEAMGNTFSGQVEIAKNKLDTFKELIGGPVIAGLTELLHVINDFDIQADFSWAGVLVSFLERWNELLSGGAPFWYSLGITLVEFKSFAPAFQDIGKIFMDLQNDLDMGVKPLDAFKTALTGLTPFITDFIQSTASAFGAAFEGALISGIETIDWNKIGLSFNAAMQEGFVIGPDGGDSALSQSMGNAFTALISGGFGYTDWDSLSVDFWEGVASLPSFDANAVMTSWFSFDADAWLQGIIDSIHFTDLGMEVYNNIIDMLNQPIFQFTDLGRNIYNAIIAGLSWSFDANAWIKIHLIDPVKEALGIASPSTIFYDIGRNIVLGLIAGWNNTVGSFLNTIGDTITDIGNLFGIDLSGLLGGSGASASGLGTASGGTSSTGTMGGGSATSGTGGTGTSTGGVVNNYYAPVYFMGGAEPGSYYDCPSPNPLVAASGNQLVVTGF